MKKSGIVKSNYSTDVVYLFFLFHLWFYTYVYNKIEH